jgi:16S rRNA (guanine(527)-N(7))-methyltransferase RsmG
MDNIHPALLSLTDVSRETLSKLSSYLTLLQKWNEKINLVSKKLDFNTLVTDHLLDCLQLSEYIENKKAKIIDIGSGAGLPGMVLAILGFENCIMVEINTKKSAFLKTVLLELGLKNIVLNNDIKKVQQENVEYIVSRAVASTDLLLDLSEHLITPSTNVILLKSKMQKKEFEEVDKKWNYELQEYQNLYKTEGEILVIKNLTQKCNKA